MKLAIYNSFTHLAFGKIVYADNIEDLLENKMSKKDKLTWEIIKYRDEDDKVMCITREFMDDQGMTLEQVKEDWRMYGQQDNPDDDIPCFPRRIRGNFPIEPVYL